MADNWDNPPQGHINFERHRMSDIELAVELKGVSTALVEIKEDIKKVEKHERDIMELQNTTKNQQSSIDRLTVSVEKLTTTIDTVTNKLTDQITKLSIKFMTGIAWVSGVAAVIMVLWVLLSNGFLHFGGANP